MRNARNDEEVRAVSTLIAAPDTRGPGRHAGGVPSFAFGFEMKQLTAAGKMC